MDHVAIEEVRLTGIPVGSEVEVRRRFDQAWARGFTVFEHTDVGYRLRRLSDGAVLPVAFPEADLRLAELTPAR
jgi:hypothetical protein